MDDIKATAIAAVLGAVGTLASALGWVVKRMWTGREAELTRLRARVDELESDRDAKLARLEAEGKERHRLLREERETTRGVRSEPDAEEAAEAAHLATIANERAQPSTSGE